ncbi:hypothetical protein KUV50_12630 [Membranicola marinus]|uniref:ATP synthase subunit b n=1 Tax=Membranihabitans marinus TaxID=1227546 RepID=A0A953HN14_9BACT|nr:hypothetical protein [Membranihabitans marinus]MBY5958989.1 hypothetical protein [Membranihabitans marinus]
MEINWFTVIAQIVNFLILVWLLKRFLYKPVLNAIDSREKKIAEQLSEAEHEKAEAQKAREKFKHKNAAFDKEKSEIKAAAAEAVRKEKQRRFDEIRAEAQALRARYAEAMARDAKEQTGLLKQKLQDGVFAISSKALEDLADADLESQIVSVFIDKINDWDDRENKNFEEALSGAGSILIESAFSMEQASRDKLEKALYKAANRSVPVRYEVVPDLVSGISIHTGKFQFSWNINSYLDVFQKEFTSLLSHKQKDHVTS